MTKLENGKTKETFRLSIIVLVIVITHAVQ